MRFSIPLDICYYVAENKVYNPFKLYLCLKNSCSGIIKIDKDFKEKAAKELGYSTVKSVDNNLKKLLALDWVGYDENTGLYYVRGFKRVRFKVGVKRRYLAKYNFDDLKVVKEFIIAAILADLWNIIKQRSLKELAFIKRGKASQVLLSSAKYMPISNKYLAQVIGCSISTAYELKKLAEECKLIKIKKQLRKTTISKKYLHAYKDANPEYSRKIVIRNGALFIQEADEVSSNVQLTKRKKPKQY
jgi:hypothetical protein